RRGARTASRVRQHLPKGRRRPRDARPRADSAAARRRSMSVSLRALRDALSSGEIVGGDAPITGVARDSREVSHGDLFVALPGEHHRGDAFVNDAVQRGASAIMASRAPTGATVPALVVADPEALLGAAAEIVYGHPTRALR